MASSSQQVKPSLDESALAHWMRRVVKERQTARRGLAADPVHDLRVALRRCVSVAEGMMKVDPSPEWKKMRKQAKRLLKRLGKLRDLQVMEVLIGKLAGRGGDSGKATLEKYVNEQQEELSSEVMRALRQFNLKQWKSWAKVLPERVGQVPFDRAVFEHLALEGFLKAHSLHRAALRNRSRMAFHRLRVALKKFRYTVENFLPKQSALWGSDFKRVQDCLGELHDLDTLWAVVKGLHDIRGTRIQETWKARIETARTEHINQYRQKMAGEKSPWSVWRAGLPEGEQLEEAGVSKLGAWASFVAPDFKHAQRVAKIALEMYDGLNSEGIGVNGHSGRSRQILHAAALMHGVGSSISRKGHHKASYRLIRQQAPPLTWSPEDLQMAAVVARYHRRALPQPDHEELKSLPPSLNPAAVFLAGILRLANVLDHACGSKEASVRVKNHPGGLVITVEGYRPSESHESKLKLAKQLLEQSCHRLVLILPASKTVPRELHLVTSRKRVA